LGIQLVRAAARKAGGPDLNPGPGKNFSLKLTSQDLLEGYSEKLEFPSNSSCLSI
jgi:hypothetical protein